MYLFYKMQLETFWLGFIESLHACLPFPLNN